MTAPTRLIPFLALSLATASASETDSGAELRLSRGFIASVVEKIPARPFEKAGQYRGNVHSFRLLAIEPQTRQIRATCQIEGDFRAPVNGPVSNRLARAPQTPDGWRHFRFDVLALVNIEPGPEGIPRFKIDIDEVKRRQLDGLTGMLATALGAIFDDLVTQIADGRAARLSGKLNEELARRVGLFHEYGVFRAIDYQPDALTLSFDVTRLRSEGVAGYVYPSSQPGTVPLYRWFHPVDKSHLYTTHPGHPSRPRFVAEGIACYVFDRETPGTQPLYHWSNGSDHLYTLTKDGDRASAHGYAPLGIAFHVHTDALPNTVPLYRFFDPIRRQHFYTTHPHAEFAK